MMFGDRLRLDVRLKLLTDLRIGSGHAREDARLHHDDNGALPELALVIRDADGQPIIPATSLKGAIRSEAPLAPSEADLLLGERGEADENKGGIARLWLDRLTGSPATNGDLAGLTKDTCADATSFIKTGVRIDRQSGTALDKHLYNQEWIGRGSVFAGSATLFIDDADESWLVQLVGRAFTPLVRDAGMALGAGERHGGGRLQLSALEVTRQSIDPQSLALVERDEPALAQTIRSAANAIPAASEHDIIRLRLVGEGPFISMRDKSTPAGEDREVTQPLERNGRPLLWPSSLLGCLRTRAAWLAEIARLRGDDRFAPGRDADAAMDDPGRVVRRREDVAQLSSIERLFGVAGWRGLLRVRHLAPADVCPNGRARLTSVTIDRFTGGAMDERLYTEEPFLFPVFDLDLVCEARGADLQTPADRDLLAVLLADIGERGLELGHGAAKGFGWFKVERRS